MYRKAFLLSIFVILISSLSLGFSDKVPYEGMEISTEFERTETCEDGSDWEETTETIFSYSNKNTETILVRTVDEGNTTTYDHETREILNGTSAGNKTSHWIDPDISIGDNVEILGETYTVRSVGTEIDTEWGEVNAIRLTNRQQVGEDAELKEEYWYDTYSGLFLRMNIEGSATYTEYYGYTPYNVECEYKHTRKLLSTGTDTNRDGENDLQEILAKRESPLLTNVSLELEADSTEVKQFEEVNLTVSAEREIEKAQLYQNGEKIGEGKKFSIKVKEPGGHQFRVKKANTKNDGLTYQYLDDSLEVEVEKLSFIENIKRLLGF